MKILGRQIQFSFSIRKERRKAERFSLHDTLYLDYKSPLLGFISGSGEGKDISTSGIRFASDSILPEGTLLDLTLHLYPVYSHAKTICLRGCVVRCYRDPHQHHYRVGCAFNHPDEAGYHQLKSFTSWLKNGNDRY